VVSINNFTKNEIDEGWLKEKTEKILEFIREQDKDSISTKEEDLELSLAVVGDGRMKKLNKLYRGKNKTTDVLAFEEKSAVGCLEKEFIYPPDGRQRLGEIVVCYPRAKKQARQKDHSLEKELTILLIHGMLHLMGYDHERGEKDKEEMEEIEGNILEKIEK
jgi:probable rRNA maturation factor